MHSDNRRAPFYILFYIAATALIIALTLYGQSAAGAFGRKSQLLASPQSRDWAGIDILEIENYITESSTLVTYEIRRQASAFAIRQSHRMNIIGTNSAYAGVMGYAVADGGFFSKTAYDAGSREAVLNERAASTLFGGGRLSGSEFTLNDEIWQIVGVVLDGDSDNDNIYVPATSALIGSGGSGSVATAATFMALQDGYSSADASITAGRLLELGISEGSHSFKSLGKAAATFSEAAAVAQYFALMLLLCLFGWRSARSAFRTIMRARAESESHVPGVAYVKRGGYLRAAANAIFFIACAAAALILARQIVGICITWQEIPLLFFTDVTPQDAFYGRIHDLGARQTTALCLFAASIIASITAVISTTPSK